MLTRMSDAARARLLGEYLTLCRVGDPRALSAFVERHPHAAGSVDEWRAAFESGRASVSAVVARGSTDASRADDPARDFVSRIASRARPSDRYRVDGEIARGGMGSVHRVWDEDLRRELAMKRVLPASDESGDDARGSRKRTRLARFVEEAQVTGRLAHPGIVPVHELGVEADGRAYFTMKLVQGDTLETVFRRVRAGEAEWSRTRALDVLLRVCEAMSYAHANGVVHRDLKPANVMVGAFGEVHVMDWGLARVVARDGASASADRELDAATDDSASGEPETDVTSRTLDGDVLGTLAYMSPEQARGRRSEIGPATDVYALGAMLYELLAGHAPHQRPGEKPDVSELWRRVREERPARLSVDDAPPELVAICERAIEPSWRSRYPDMSALAADLRAFLEGRVVRAYRTGAWAEARKWVGRNRALSGALAAGLLAVIAGLVVAIHLRRVADENAAAARSNAERASELARVADEKRSDAERAELLAREQRAEAQRNADETKLVADFQTRILARISLAEFGRDLVSAMQGEVAESRARAGAGEDETRRAAEDFGALVAPVNASNVARHVLEKQIFEPAVESIDEGYADRPRIAALLYTPVAEVLRALALFEPGARCARAALEAKKAALGEGHRETLAAQANLALHLRGLGRGAEAEPLLRDAITRLEAMTDEEKVVIPTLQANLALLVAARGDDVETERLLRDAYERQRALFGDRSASTNTTKFSLAQFLQERERLAEAETLMRDTLDYSRETEGDSSVPTLTMGNSQGLLLRSLGRLDEAETLTRQGLEIAREHHGDRHPVTVALENTLGLVLSRKGRPAEAEPLLRRSLAQLILLEGEDAPHVLMATNNLAVALQAMGRPAEAEPVARAAYEGIVRTIGRETREALMTGSALAAVWLQLGRLNEAEDLWRDTLTIARKIQGDDGIETVRTLGRLGSVLRLQQRFADAEPIYRELVERSRRLQGSDQADTIDAVHNHGSCLRRTGRVEESLPLYREALAWRRVHFGAEKELTLRSQTGLGLALSALGQWEESEALLSGILKILRTQAARNPDIVKDAATGLRDVYRARHELEPGAGFDARAAEVEAEWMW